ncbi:hypothetical protein DFH07DRAFT_978094 [Mycena maculata]|uniref:Uncharacterized protein n=1 Tax=Mycena maculata TaxID=230809 RepID=A0AAD7N534_9AGAR|nr:hypothetical protein DFH07DRAFT_978094 [Mycena maculata]
MSVFQAPIVLVLPSPPYSSPLEASLSTFVEPDLGCRAAAYTDTISMDPRRTAYLNEETPHQIRDRLRFYRAHNVKFVEYFPDGTCRELERNDSLDVLLLAKMPFPDIQLRQVQQMMSTLRYFLFDLQNSMREIVPHHGPAQTLSNMVFYRQYSEGYYGLIFPVQTNTYAKCPLHPSMRDLLAQTPLEDEAQLQQSFVASGNAYYLDTLINRVIFDFGREVRKIELQERLQTMVKEQYPAATSPRSRNTRRLHWSMAS